MELLPSRNTRVRAGRPAMKLHSALVILLLSTAPAFAQQAKPVPTAAPQMPPALITPEVHSDDSVTFRFRAPNAQEVSVRREGVPDPLPMQKDENGVWTVNTAPLPPDYSEISLSS